MTDIQEQLFLLQDKEYAVFQGNLTPGVDKTTIIGVRVPLIKKLAKDLLKQEKVNDFLKELPHRYYDENMLHSAILSNIKEFGYCLENVDRFLPFIDNWAVCDTLRPKALLNNKEVFLTKIREWIKSDKEYTCRFGTEMLMTYYLDDNYDFQLLKQMPFYITKVREYYAINGNREENVGKYLAISDMFFLLFDFDFFNQDFIKLTFWANIKSLLSMKELTKDHIGTFNWRIKGGKTYSMKLESEDITQIVDFIMKNLKDMKIEYSVTKKNLGPKEGVLPNENIDEVEKEIRELEEISDDIALIHSGKIIRTGNIDSLCSNIHKIQAVFESVPETAIFESKLDVIKTERTGSVLQMVVRGDREKILNFIKNQEQLN